eukprot:TRINITY_DN2407_c0_g1_i3.p1 TRINITY_DN2407_c0_g1~~TRINITY_DN2407_c0_g1_i3.p1  ORF type:complete len:159 (+),score=0.96 TRINITY_DN2407_c0_g1_i3:96-572(+)
MILILKQLSGIIIRLTNFHKPHEDVTKRKALIIMFFFPLCLLSFTFIPLLRSIFIAPFHSSFLDSFPEHLNIISKPKVLQRLHYLFGSYGFPLSRVCNAARSEDHVETYSRPRCRRNKEPTLSASRTAFRFSIGSGNSFEMITLLAFGSSDKVIVLLL